jgi:phosphoribosylanthranilate isomerase
MIIKVCGLRVKDQIEYLDKSVAINWLGTIFYNKSKRYSEQVCGSVKKSQKVGVFVDQELTRLLEIVKLNQLDIIQLHGHESPTYCETIKKNYTVIKAFGIDEQFDFEQLVLFQQSVHYFLFDTKTSQFGGSGTYFDWKLLHKYSLDIPFLLSGGLTAFSMDCLLNFQHPRWVGIDLNSGFEKAPGDKDVELIENFILEFKKQKEMKTKKIIHGKPDEMGFYGQFGGAYIPEVVRPNVLELKQYFSQIQQDEGFQEEFKRLLTDYVGRPTPLYLSSKMTVQYGCPIFLKREDLNHTGAHKINNAIGQILVAKRMGKTVIVAETGAGQHGVATATVCALMQMKCIIYMGEKDMERQQPNVQRMIFLGAEVLPASSGSKTLKDATNEAIRFWINHPSAYYLIGSVVGPHPYPEMVAYFQSIISKEIKIQLKEKTGTPLPTKVIACVGGGSNAAGAFFEYYEEEDVELIAVEAAGLGNETGYSAATSVLGTPGVLHGSMTLLIQDEHGQVVEPYSISAGLDYPGIGPLHAFSIREGRTKSISVTDIEALFAAKKLTREEGIIPALESAHALAALEKIELRKDDVVVINLSGRGDKDLDTFISHDQNESI